jgi:hypothetical protein
MSSAWRRGFGRTRAGAAASGRPARKPQYRRRQVRRSAVGVGASATAAFSRGGRTQVALRNTLAGHRALVASEASWLPSAFPTAAPPRYRCARPVNDVYRGPCWPPHVALRLCRGAAESRLRAPWWVSAGAATALHGGLPVSVDGDHEPAPAVGWASVGGRDRRVKAVQTLPMAGLGRTEPSVASVLPARWARRPRGVRRQGTHRRAPSSAAGE